MTNAYIPFSSTVTKIIRHTDIEYTFRMTFEGDVKPGQFFEVSIPKYGEAPISVSGIGPGTVDLTIRKVGRVTNRIFENYEGNTLLMRGPYGNGFDLEQYKGKELFIIAGGTGLSPVKGIVDYFSKHPEEAAGVTLIAGFKSPEDILFRDDFAVWKQKLNVIQTVDTAPEGYEGPTGMVTKYIPDLNIRQGPGTDKPKTGKVTGVGVFTIVEEADGKGASRWGLLKSYQEKRDGWISLDYAKRV